VLFIVSLVAGAPHGFGNFLGGTGLGQADLVGIGSMTAGAAIAELIRAYAIAIASLIPVALLAICLTVWLMNAAGGALATLATLILMQLLIIFPWLEPFLLGAQLSAYASPDALWGRALVVITFYSVALAMTAVILFERKDF
jgi:ABC-2 type transport system permease protein